MIYIPHLQSGNIKSVTNAISHMELGINFELHKNPPDLTRNDLIILPGVGDIGNFINELKELFWYESIIKHYKNNGKLIGICVGFQSFFSKSEEDENVDCFDFFEGTVERMNKGRSPVIGFANVNNEADDIGEFYFVHSYGVNAIKNSPKGSLRYHNMHGEYLAGVVTKNICGFQFHPEKSGPAGLQYLKNIILGVIND